jgi:hypothetical protein
VVGAPYAGSEGRQAGEEIKAAADTRSAVGDALGISGLASGIARMLWGAQPRSEEAVMAPRKEAAPAPAPDEAYAPPPHDAADEPEAVASLRALLGNPRADYALCVACLRQASFNVRAARRLYIEAEAHAAAVAAAAPLPSAPPAEDAFSLPPPPPYPATEPDSAAASGRDALAARPPASVVRFSYLDDPDGPPAEDGAELAEAAGEGPLRSLARDGAPRSYASELVSQAVGVAGDSLQYIRARLWGAAPPPAPPQQ